MQRKCPAPLRGEKFIFPSADGTVKLSGGDQVLRTSTLIWEKWNEEPVQRFAPCTTVLQLPERFSLAFRTQSKHHAHQVASSNRQAAQFPLVPPSQRALDSGPCTPQYVHTLSTFKRKTSSSDSPILSCVSRSGNRSSRHEKSRSAPFTTQVPRCSGPREPTHRVHPVNRREHLPWASFGVPFASRSVR